MHVFSTDFLFVFYFLLVCYFFFLPTFQLFSCSHFYFSSFLSIFVLFQFTIFLLLMPEDSPSSFWSQ